MSAEPGRTRPSDALSQAVIVHVSDTISPELTGYDGCVYESPPQPREQALRLVRVLIGSGDRVLNGCNRWELPVAGGRRSVWLSAAADPRWREADTEGWRR